MDERIKILLFGILAENIGSNELNVPYVKDSDSLLKILREKYTILNEFVFSIAINRRTISENTILNNQDEVALLPPFSGG